MENFAEKRRFPRIETRIPVRYRKLGAAGTQGTGTLTRNMSEGGIRFRTREFISMACRLILELDIPMIPKPVKAISRVAWIRKAPKGDDYEIGNQFLEISKQDKEVVSQYMDSLSVYNDGEGADAS